MIHSIYNFVTLILCVVTGWAYAIWLLVTTNHWSITWFVGPVSTFIVMYVLVSIQDWSERKLFGYSINWET